MGMKEQDARKLVVRAGQELVKSGLIARTWGNVSCRIDDKTFAITPSGRSYETLEAHEIVLCRIEDTSYDGDIKPSSEKGTHALVYQTYPDINFVIHTHQPMASAISTIDIRKMPPGDFSLLGDGVAISDYGLPGTKKLKKGVDHALRQNNQGHAVIMAHHGALCFGKDYEETFTVAKQLEEACLSFLGNTYLKKNAGSEFNLQKLYQHYVSLYASNQIKAQDKPHPFYRSQRIKDGFILEAKSKKIYRFSDDMPDVARYHCEIYRSRDDINYICQDTESGLFALSLAGTPLEALLDDFAQIVGRNVKCVKNVNANEIEKALRGRLGVLVPGYGAICCAATESDLQAVGLVMEKNAFAQIGAALFGGSKALSLFDCWLMHLVYSKSYSKKAK